MLSLNPSYKVPLAQYTNSVHAPAAATAAVVTLTAPGAGMRRVIQSLQWSYDTTPTGGRLTITSASDTIKDLSISAAGPGSLNFPVIGGINEEVVVTLASGAGTVVGKINVDSFIAPE